MIPDYKRQRLFNIENSFERKDSDINTILNMIDTLYNDIRSKDDNQLVNFNKIINEILDSALSWADMTKPEINKKEIDIRREIDEIDKKYKINNDTNDPTMVELNTRKKILNEKLDQTLRKREANRNSCIKEKYKAVGEGQSELFYRNQALSKKKIID